MADGEGLDELEYESLQGSVSRVESLLANSVPDVQPLLESFLKNARMRLKFLEKEIKEHKEEKEHHEKEQVAIAQMAQQEAALSESEKQTYSGFLAKEFFTKNDFKQLEQFYSHTWDRLSEGGKDEMSHRVWEGIRRDEYKFSELPSVVQQKESERVYKRLTSSAIESGIESRIPADDRQDFINAYESGKRKEAAKVLDRESFKQNMFRNENTKEIQHSTVGSEKKAEQDNIREKTASVKTGEAPAPATKSGARANLDLSDLNKNGVQLVETASQSSSAEIPNVKDGNAGRDQSVRGV